MTTNPASAILNTHEVYPVSGGNAPYAGEADAGEFFSTLLDIINPLQHIPLVSTLYRELTGDELNPAARMVGGAIFGGPIGFASASANVLLEQLSGEDVAGHALALLSDDAPDPLESVTPALQASNPKQLKTDMPLQQAAADFTGPEPEDIIWSGPRITPTPPISNNIEIIQNVMPKSSTTESSVVSAVEVEAEAPVWLEKSHDAAQRVEAARANGTLTQTRTAQPWVANAMFDALDKYEALARARTEKVESDTGS